MDRSACRRAGRARGRVPDARPDRKRHAVPADDDLRRRAAAAQARRRHSVAGRRMAAENSVSRLRSARVAGHAKGVGADRYGHDRASGRVRCARQYDPCRASRGNEYRLTGHKWFFSAPMCDAHLVLAQAPKGLSCFFLPRVLPDGARNAVRLQRLKDKLGNRSNASCEVEFAGATGWLLGDEGRGVQVIIEMVQHTRLDCAIGSAGIVKSAAAQALHHARHRRAFGRPLAEQPLMQNVLADLAIEAEAAVQSALRLASTFEANANEAEAALSRLATPALKYWLCKRAPMVVAEAIEVLG